MRKKRSYRIVVNCGTNENAEIETSKITIRKLIQMISSIIRFWRKEDLTYLEIEIERLEERSDKNGKEN